MGWRDWVFMVGGLWFLAALVGSPPTTSLFTGIVGAASLTAFAACHCSYRNWLAAAVAAATAALWLLLGLGVMA